MPAQFTVLDFTSEAGLLETKMLGRNNPQTSLIFRVFLMSLRMHSLFPESLRLA
jgi:hypothetical protein